MGNLRVANASGAFEDASNLIWSANDKLELFDKLDSGTPVVTLDSMFKNCSSFNGNLSSWNVSNVLNMESMFAGDTAGGNSMPTPLDINSWDVSNVTTFNNIFNDDSKCTCGRAGEEMPKHPSICGKCGGWF